MTATGRLWRFVGAAVLVLAVLATVTLPTGVLAQVAREAGLGRESLYKALSPNGNPEFATVLRVIAALGLALED